MKRGLFKRNGKGTEAYIQYLKEIVEIITTYCQEGWI